MIFWGIYCEKAALCGGNWNDDLIAGPFYANLNNAPSNSNTNIGAALSYPLTSHLMQYISSQGSDRN
ncbi:hypothetical protein [Barnesiella intestinihominis]|uniref:hypothetical protein n=1 Tax=Barnesiella intestinihominis TaxID=487174 RepID=UPI002430CFC0|nr:hypothetical protein [Barnesiella intestinihominis]